MPLIAGHTTTHALQLEFVVGDFDFERICLYIPRKVFDNVALAALKSPVELGEEHSFLDNVQPVILYDLFNSFHDRVSINSSDYPLILLSSEPVPETERHGNDIFTTCEMLCLVADGSV
ncbi:hypothetical protein FP744_10006432 [Trichoderma asperellum]